MRNTVLLVLIVCFVVAFAQDKPKNYFAGSISTRGQQQQVNGFAVWNITSSTWVNAMTPRVGGGSVAGIIAIGSGLLAYGDFTNIGGKDAAGLAYYEGAVWCAPEGVGLYTYNPNIFTTQYNNTPTAKSSAFAATVIGTDVYLLGGFNQVGLVRDGVAGFVKLSWSAGGVFTINKIGSLGYYQVQNTGTACTFCPRGTQPLKGSTNKLLTYTTNSLTYFVFQDSTPGNLYQWQVDSQNWIQITGANVARNLTGAINDFDINSGNIFVVGNFQNLLDPNPANQYLHIACSVNQGASWTAIANPGPLPNVNFGNLGVLINNSTGIQLPALTGTGLTSIAIENLNSIYVAGGWRITERNITLDNLAGQLQTRVFKLSGSTYTLASERFAGASFGASPNFNGPTINKLLLANNVLYAFGDFSSYRQVVPLQGSRFGNRFTDVYKGAAQLSNGQWSPAFGGYLTTSFSGDLSPSTVSIAYGPNLVCFSGSFLSSYNLLSGGVFAYGGDKNAKKDNRWNSALQNQRFVTSTGFNSGIGAEGSVYSLYVPKKNDALIIGGKFDWIGSQRIGGIAAYNPTTDTVQQIGGGIYQTNNNFDYFSDNSYNNRVGGSVYDIDEWNQRLIIAGVFNRNNSGNCVSNIAWNKFRENGAGWEAIDGGCDGPINDILIDGSILYATGDFRYCGLNPAGYKGGLFRGAVPTSRIARIDLNDNNRNWRNLGIGLNGIGNALAWRNGELFVGGSFSSAGGRISTGGIARWRDGHWYDVVAKCRGNCDRPVNVIPYITGTTPTSDSRKPNTCTNLKTIGGRVYCIDSNKLAYFDSNTWYQAGALTVSTTGSFQNSLISVNKTESRYIIVPTTLNTDGSNGANYGAFDSSVLDFDVSFGGFSTQPLAFASASTISVSLFAIILIIIAFLF